MLLGIMAGIAWMVLCALLVKQPFFERYWFGFVALNALVGAALFCLGQSHKRRPETEAEHAANSEEGLEKGLPLNFWVFVFGAASLLVLANRLTGKDEKWAAAGGPATNVATINGPVAEVQKEREPAPSTSLPTEAPAAAASGSQESQPFPNLKFQGVTFNPPDSSVIINRLRCRIGDKIQGAEITEITKSSVTLRFQNESHTLTL
jgi:hypothetical protein